MSYPERIKSDNDLKIHAAELIRQLDSGQDPYIITQNGKPKAVLQSFRDYQRNRETLSLLKILELGNAQIESGKFRLLADVTSRLRASRLGT